MEICMQVHEQFRGAIFGVNFFAKGRQVDIDAFKVTPLYATGVIDIDLITTSLGHLICFHGAKQ